MQSTEKMNGNFKNYNRPDQIVTEQKLISHNNSPMFSPKFRVKQNTSTEKSSELSSFQNKNIKNYTNNDSDKQQNNSIIQIENCDVEGEQKIKRVEAYRLSISKCILSILLSLATGLVSLLLIRNSIKFRVKSLYKSTTVHTATYFLITNCDGKQEIVNRVKQDDKNKIQFINRHMKYQYYQDEQRQYFSAVFYHQIEKQQLCEIKENHKNGLTDEKLNSHLDKFGKCMLNIPVPTLFAYLSEVLTQVFFIFQYFTMLLWALEGSVLFSIVMIVASFSITLLNYYLLRLSLNKLKTFASIDLKVKVIRNGQIQEINSIDLLPGDLFYYKNQMFLPCDSLLIEGDVLINESSLTGESLPVPKISIGQYEDQSAQFNIETMKKHVLLEGTRVIQIKGEQVFGIVLRTGYTSFRGGIFRAMLYPKEVKFNFYKNGIYFLLTLMVIGMLVYFGMLYKVIEIEVPTILVIYRFFDAATWMIPPALPIFFSICQTISLIRLGTKKIFATDPAKVVVSGDVSIMCFDKTGTLTNDTMEIYGYTDYNCTQIKHTLIEESGKEELLHKCFGSCHGVYLIDGQNLGDELDVKMLEFSNYSIIDEQSVDYKFRVKKGSSSDSFLTIHKVWEFESSLQRMTCIMADDQDNKIYSIVKGSPEVIFDICIKSSIDELAFKSMVSQLTNQGLRVIALGCKQLNNNYTEKKDKANSDQNRKNEKNKKDQNLIYENRDEVEQNIEFIGLFVLENRLKNDSSDVIKCLKNGNITCKVISGDHLLTTVQCAKQANIMHSDANNILLCNSLQDCYVQGTNQPLDPLKLLSSNQASMYQIGITGIFLQELQTKFNNNYGLQEQNILNNLLNQTYVFSRCKPQQKAEIIHLFQVHLKEKIGMIGDGANDCTAIKQADIGISFTKTDASYSSPFSYSETSLKCVILILAEGRCTLSNMIECFRYYLTSSVNKYTIACILILEFCQFSSFLLIFINYFVSIPFLLMVSLSEPLDELVPQKSISNMLDIENFICVYGQIIISIAQFLTLYFHLIDQNWFKPVSEIEEQNQYVKKGMSVHVLFLACCMVFIFSILSYYISYPSKKKIYSNKLLSISMLIVFTYILLLYLIPQSMASFAIGLDQTVTQHTEFLRIQFLISLSFGFAMLFYEEIIVKRYLSRHRKRENRMRKTGSIVN